MAEMQGGRNLKDNPGLNESFRTFGRIGLLSFGGPAAQIAVMHRILVEEKKWLTEDQFLHALNFCMLLPGPEAMQLATYAGWLKGGVRGGLLAGLLFILPGLAMMLVLSAIYVLHGTVPFVAGLMFGLKAAVLAVVIEALMRVSKRALKSNAAYGIALVAFIAIAFFHVPFPAIILAAALCGIALKLGSKAPSEFEGLPVDTGPSAWRQSIRAMVLWGAVWAIPLATLWFALPNTVLADAALFFSKVAVVTFGGAYAVLAYVGQQAVNELGWLTDHDMLAGLGLAETTLGPLVLVLVFVGFLAGAGMQGLGLLSGGLAGGLIAAFFTFVPCFLWIFAGAPHMERLRHVRWLSSALAGITAAVVGVIANLGLWFGLAVLFRQVGQIDFGPLTLPLPALETADLPAIAIALASAIALLRYHVNLMIVLALAALVGLVLTYAGLV